MDSGVVYEGLVRQPQNEEFCADDGNVPKLFTGLKLWFSHSIPQRKWLMENAQANGASIVNLEQQADVRLVDHARSNQAPGTFSYRFVEVSIKKGQLEDLESHRVGSTARVDRPVGSTVIGPKGTRAAYTKEEDQFLWNIVTPFRQNGGSWKGNAIYKEVERQRPRHTYQSWRDRYIKYVQHRRRTITTTIDLQDDVQHATAAHSVEQQPPTVRPTSTAARQTSPHKRQRLTNAEDESNAPQMPPTPPQTTRNVSQPNKPARSPRLPLSPPSANSIPRSGLEADTQSALPVTHGQQGPIFVHWSPTQDNREQPSPDHRPAGTTKASNPPMKPNAAGETQIEPDAPSQPSRRAASPHLTPESQQGATVPLDEDRQPAVIPDVFPGNFGRQQFKKLWRISQHILDCPRNGVDVAQAFDEVAKEYHELEHSGQEWRLFWQIHVLPNWLQRRGRTLSDIDSTILFPDPDTRADSARPIPIPDGEDQNQADSDEELAGIACSHCYTRESIRWRRDRRGKIFCNDCGTLLKESRMRSISGIAISPRTSPAMAQSVAQCNPKYSDAIVQTSPLQSPRYLPTNRVEVHDDDDPFLTADPPGPNQSRKRSAGRTSQSTSQNTNKSNERPIDDRPGALDGELRPLQLATATEKEIEIPSTPEQLQGGADMDDGFRSPDRPPLRELPISGRQSSSLLVPGNGDEPTLFNFNDRVGTTPMAVRQGEDALIEEPILVATSSLSDKENDDPSSEADEIFETTPEMSQDWETAPESLHPRERRLYTPELFQTSKSTGQASNFELPAPEGGWDFHGIAEPEDDAVAAIDETPEMVEISSDLEEEEIDIDTWLDEQKALHHGVKGIDPMLKTAIEATSFDFTLAAQVVVRMVEHGKTDAGRQLRREGKVPPPDDVAGCWTEADDNLLHSPKARHRAEIEQKHGRENCELRLEFLEAYDSV